ncbi:putative tetratricopeptide-like helical domain superfamily, DYW domain-containing protein [Helianthus annuus]|nr:putative tetratricopeptide-like helical domain superfamily, DYW domain-containing protein [Helianthus annuus]
MGSAHKVFDEMPERDAISWTSLIVAYARQGSMEEALGATKYAKWVQDVADRAGLGATDNIVIGSALINMYAKCGCIEEARNVFDKMKNKNVYSYSSLILGLAMHGCAQEAISLFERFLGACCHAGLVQQGQNFFAEMEKEYGVTEPLTTIRAWLTFLEGLDSLTTPTISSKPCQCHHMLVFGGLAWCFYLFELEPNAIGNYILLSNTYASARKWNEVSRIRALFRSKGLKKNPASSWVEGEKGVIHEFFAGDMNHPRTSEIKRELEDLVYKLMLDGYTPVLSCVPYDVSDDEKKRILLGHSEKLALAYGLLVDCGIIRIMKNVRICEDCHVVMCGASKISGREIIVRDNTRFHHFCNGVCSCNNFW